MLYDFYAEMRGKKLAGAWAEMKRYEEEPTDLFEYGGKLKKELIVVDIDNNEHAELLSHIIEKENIKCVIRKTSRGKHFYFKNTDYTSNKSTMQCAIGLTIELKVGKNRTLNPIKQQGKVREFEKIVDELDEIPLFLKPISKTYPVMFKMDSNRNDTLRDIQLYLAKKNIDYQNYLKIATVINNYVFSEPLFDKFGFNKNGVLREELYPEVLPEFFSGKTFLHVAFAEYLKKKFHLINIDEVLHIYENGVYIASNRLIKKAMLQVIPILKRTQRQEVLNYLELTSDSKKVESADLIPFQNCIFNIKTSEISEHSPEKIFKNILSVNYINNGSSNIIDNVLNNIAINDLEIKQLLLEMIGYTMYRRNELGKAFILVGPGSNGKSTLLKLIKKIVGMSNVSALDLNQLDDKFKTWKLYGKLVNLGDDISSSYISDSSYFKKIATGELITVEKKGENAFEFENYATMIYTANKLPKSSDKSDGFYRRFMPVPLLAQFKKSNNNFDLEIVDKLNEQDELDYLAHISIKAFKEVLGRQEFTTPGTVKTMLKEYKISNSNVLLFLDDYESEIEESTLSSLYLSYQAWCNESGHKHCSKGEFKSEVADTGYIPNAKTTRLFGRSGKYFIKTKSH